MRRITVKMAKAKNYNKKVINKILDEWFETYIMDDATIGDNVKHMLIQFAGALFFKNISNAYRIRIIEHQLDTVALTMFTPAAWEYLKECIIEDINENYELKKAKVSK